MIGGFGNAIAVGDIDGYEKVSYVATVTDWSSYIESGVLNDGVYDARYKDVGEKVSLGEGEIKCIYQNTPVATWCSYTYSKTTTKLLFWDTTDIALYKTQCSNGCDAKTGLCKPEIAVPEGYKLSVDSTANRVYRCGECYGEVYDPTGQPCFGWFKDGSASGVEPNSFGYFYLGSDDIPTNVCFPRTTDVYFRMGDRSSPDYSGDQRVAGAYFCDSFGRTYYKHCPYGCAKDGGGCEGLSEPPVDIIPKTRAVPGGYTPYEDSDGAQYVCGEGDGELFDSAGQPYFGYFRYDHEQMNFVNFDLWDDSLADADIYMGAGEGDIYALCSMNGDIPVSNVAVGSSTTYMNSHQPGAYFCDGEGQMYYKLCSAGCDDYNLGYCDGDSVNTETGDSDDGTTGTDDETQTDLDSSTEVAVDRITYENKPGLFYKHTSDCTHPGNYICVERDNNEDVSLLWYCNPADDKKYYMICPTDNCMPPNGISTVGYCAAEAPSITEIPNIEFILDTDEAIIALDSAAGVNSVAYMFGNKVGSIYAWSDDWFWYGCNGGTSCDVIFQSTMFGSNHYIAIKAYALNGIQTERIQLIE